MPIYVSAFSEDLNDALSELIGAHFEIIKFENLKNCEFEEDSFVFFDYLEDSKFYIKAHKFFSKKKLNMKTVLIVDEMSPKELKKHQKSKLAANFYLKFPLNFQILASILDIQTESVVQEINIQELESIPKEPSLNGPGLEVLTPPIEIPSFDMDAIDASVEDSSDNLIEETRLSSKALDVSNKLDSIMDTAIGKKSISSVNKTQEVAGILEEEVLDEVIEEFEDISLLDPTPQEDLTLKIEFESDQLFPSDDDLEYPDMDATQSHEDALLKEIASESEESFEFDSLEVKPKDEAENLTPLNTDNLNLDASEDLPVEDLNTEANLNLEDDLSLGEDMDLNLEEETDLTSEDSLDLGIALSLVEDETSNKEVDLSAELNLPEDSDIELEDDFNLNTSDELNFDEVNSDLDLKADLDLSEKLEVDVEESLNLNSSNELSLDEDISLDNDLSLSSDGSLDLGVEIDNSSDDSLDLSFDEKINLEGDLDLSSDDSLDLGTGLDLSNEDNSDLDLNINSDIELSGDSSADLSFGEDEADGPIGIDLDEEITLENENNISDTNNEIALDSSSDEDTMGLGLSFDTLDEGISDEGLTEPNLGLGSNKTVASHEIDPVDQSLSFNVAKMETLEQVEEENQEIETKLDESLSVESNTVESQLSEIDEMMNEDIAVDATSDVDEERYTDEQLIKLTETIKFLRHDRDMLERKLETIEDGQLSERRNFQLYKSQLEEKNIEIDIMQKRHTKQVEKLQKSLDAANKQKEILIEKNRQIISSVEESHSKKEYDLNRVRKREIELENKLEMLKADTKIQLKTREDKIIELKRRIDTLEFDMNTIQNQESRSLIKRTQLEGKLDSVIGTLRDAIEDLENKDAGLENIEELSKRLKKSI